MISKKPFILVMIAVIVSFIGFCVENIFISFSSGFMDNRNMILPFLFGYGLSMLLYYFLFGTPNSPLLFGRRIAFKSSTVSNIYSFFMAFIGICIGEIILGYAIELTCDIIWWDYTTIPLHITRYTSVPTSMGFAFLLTLFMKYCFDPLYNAFSKMNTTALIVISVCFALVLSADMLNSAIYMYQNHNTQILWRLDFNKPMIQHIIKTKN